MLLVHFYSARTWWIECRFDDSCCTAWSRLKLSTKNGRSHALHCTVYQLRAFMNSRGWLTFSQGKSLYSYPMMGVRGTLHPFSRAFLHRNTSTSCFILDRLLSSYNGSCQSIFQWCALTNIHECNVAGTNMHEWVWYQFSTSQWSLPPLWRVL